MEREVIKSNIQGIQRILEIIASSHNDDICLSQFSNMDENLCAVLGAFHKDGRMPISVNAEIHPKFINNQFAKALSLDSADDEPIGKDVIPYFEIERNDYQKGDKKVLYYIQHYILLAEHVPKISEKVKIALQDAILEFFDNAFGHTKCGRVFACGKWNRFERKFYLTIVNLGETFKDKIGAYLGKNLASEQAIQWAMVMGHSTKLRDSGGLGLSIITEFVRMNEGEFLLISGDGVLCMHGSESNYEKISGFFPGTFVNLVFDLSDPKKYMKTDENQSTVNFEW